jgi:RimJ/RimL family protein N-acetyltransferase
LSVGGDRASNEPSVATGRQKDDVVSDRFASDLIGSRLELADLGRIRGHYLRLNAADRLNHFRGFIGDDALDAYVKALDFDRKIFLGLTPAKTGQLVALVELWLDDLGSPDVAEIAVSVDGGWRGNGLGLQLVAHAADMAFDRGASTVELHFEPDNHAIKRLVRKLGGRLDSFEGKADMAAPMPIAA